MQARYTREWLRNTGDAVDSDGTNGWGFVIDTGKVGPFPVLVVEWLSGVKRPVLIANLELRKETKDGWAPFKAPKGWTSYDSSVGDN